MARPAPLTAAATVLPQHRAWHPCPGRLCSAPVPMIMRLRLCAPGQALTESGHTDLVIKFVSTMFEEYDILASRLVLVYSYS